MTSEQVQDSIRRHFSTFADPATPVHVDDRVVRWTQRREQREVALLRDSDSELPLLKWKDQIYRYRDFFASDIMADLRSLAETVQRMITPISDYYDGPAILEWEEPPSSHEHDRGLRALSRATGESLPPFSTRLVFLRGSAGAGKTALLRTLSKNVADAFLRGQNPFLLLYVDAQGRALSKLDEALAYVLQDHRAAFTYHAVSTLVQLGLVVPIIDGFDELLGVGGYNEAFSSLASFLAKLEGQGAVVTSSRATFFEFARLNTRELDPRTAREDLRYSVLPITLPGWNRDDVASYCSSRDAKSEAVLEALAGLGGQNDGRFDPFFVARASDLLLEGDDISSDDFLGTLVRAFLRREADKLRRPDSTLILSVEQHLQLLEALAEEMWWQETRELDRNTVHAIAELVCEELDLHQDELIVVRDRLFSHALLGTGADQGRVAFTHEYFFAYCLAERLHKAILTGGKSLDVLARGTISPVVANEIVRRSLQTGYVFSDLTKALASRSSRAFTDEIIASNVGEITAATIRNASAELSGETVSKCSLSNVDLSKTSLASVAFVDVSFVNVNLRDAVWRDVSCTRCTLSEIAVNDQTRIRASGISEPGTVQSVRVERDGMEISVYDPIEVARVLAEIGSEERTEESEPLETTPQIQVLRRFLRMMSRNWCYSDNDLENRGLSRRPEWSKVEELLVGEGLVGSANIAKQGPSPSVRRLAVPVRLLQQGERGPTGNQAVDGFWSKLRSL